MKIIYDFQLHNLLHEFLDSLDGWSTVSIQEMFRRPKTNIFRKMVIAGPAVIAALNIKRIKYYIRAFDTKRQFVTRVILTIEVRQEIFDVTKANLKHFFFTISKTIFGLRAARFTLIKIAGWWLNWFWEAKIFLVPHHPTDWHVYHVTILAEVEQKMF